MICNSPNVNKHVRDIPPCLPSPVGFIHEQRSNGTDTVLGRVCSGSFVYAEKYDFYERKNDHPHGRRVTRIFIFILPIGDGSARVFHLWDYPVDVPVENFCLV